MDQRNDTGITAEQCEELADAYDDIDGDVVAMARELAALKRAQVEPVARVDEYSEHHVDFLGNEIPPHGTSLYLSSPTIPADRPGDLNVSIEVYQYDWIPGFAAFLGNGRIHQDAKAHVVLNLGGNLGAVATGEFDAQDLPYIIAEHLMHEVIHVLEAWAGVEFSEDRVEALIDRYRASAGYMTEATATNNQENNHERI